MAKKDTMEALQRRGVSPKTADLLADAGYTLAALKKVSVQALAKHVSREEAQAVLQALGVKAKAKVAPPKAKAKAKGKPPEQRAPAKAPQAKKVRAVAAARAPEPTPEERKILDLLQAKARGLPQALVRDVAAKTQRLRLTKEDLERVLDRIWEDYATHLIDPNESCGIVSAQSIGEPGTQMSLPYEEGVLVRLDGVVRVLPIGELVDGLLRRHPVSRQGTTEWVDLPADAGVRVPSLSADGKVVWKAVRAASRHVCEESLLRLRMRTGRTITATGNHSFVTRRDGRIAPVRGDTLRPGDRLPVLRRWDVEPAQEVDVSAYLPKDAYWYGSELAKARALDPGWRRGYGEDYVVPVGPDALGRHVRGKATLEMEDGFVYPYQNHSQARLPERAPLDAPLGWLVGAYLAEGWAAPAYVNVSNTGEAFLARTRAAADGFRIGYGEYDNGRGFVHGHDLHLRSTVLAALLRRACGGRSAEKRVPDFAYGAPEPFVGALLRAYFEGDGNVTVERGAIRASSSSKALLDGVVLLLGRFGILASRRREGGQHTLWVPRRFALRFREAIGFESTEKRTRLERLCARPEGGYTVDALDMVSGFGTILRDVARKLHLPTRTVNSFTRRQRIGRATLARHFARFQVRAEELGVDVSEELDRLWGYLEEDVSWDEIVAVESVDPPARPVYDLSVPGLETFTTAEGVVTHNTMRTFHYAGVAEMNVTLGLPRLIEIVDARRVPSTPVMEVFLREGKADLERMRRYAQEIEMTHLEDVAEIETDVLNDRVTVYPHEARMRSRGVTWDDLDQALKKMKREKVRRVVGDEEREVEAYVLESGQASYKRLQRLLEQVKGTKIKGIDGVHRAIIRRRGEEYVIYTEGSNLAAALQLPYVDPTRTNSNNITEIHEVLGIEAARNAIIREASETLAEQGLTVDIRHIMLVSDMMTNDGDVKAIGRHGISGRKSSVLARAAFEITSHHLLKAAITGEVDYLDGVAENVIVGQPVTLGTGAVNLVFRAPAAKEG